MALKRFLMIGFVAALVACGDDDSSDFATRPGEDSSSACEDCDGSSSSKAKSSDSETSVSSSSSAKSSSSAASSSSKDVEPVETSSSSSSVDSSSSSAKSSSSVAYVEPCRTDSVDTCEYETLTDDRDGQTYKTVKIGEQWWMAENLNYETVAGSSCFNDSAKYCEKYGRLYTWATAVGKSEDESGYVRGVCPKGWHLPDTTEWNALFTAVGGWATAGKTLKSTEGWNNNGNGSDSYSFSALPAGIRHYNGDYYDEGLNAFFWSSTEYSSYGAYRMYMYYNHDCALQDLSTKDYGFSVRCLKD